MRALTDDIRRMRAEGQRLAIATVVATRASSSQPVGAKLVVGDRGGLAGAVSGGCVEADVRRAALEVVQGAPPVLLTYGAADELTAVGLPCGGEIDVFVERLR